MHFCTKQKYRDDFVQEGERFLRTKKANWLLEGGYVKAFLFAAITAAIFIVPYMVKGTFYIGSDFVHQQVPFWSYANAAIKSGDVFWTDRIDLGTQFIGAFSFYGLGSVFFWLSLLLPAGVIPYVMGPLLILKCGVAGLTSYMWLKRYTKTQNAALLGSLLYAFCGFQISNLNFNHFADVVALFPLLLWALDRAMLDKKKFGFIMVVALNALCNWFCFFGEVVFLIIYFVVKVWCKEYTLTKKRFFSLGAESLLGVGIAACLLLPSVLFMLANPRAATESGGLVSLFIMKPIYFADLIRGMLMPPECGFYRGFFMQGLFNGGELYLPLFGLVPAAAYLLNKRKSFEARLIAICLVFMLVPVLNSMFVAFNSEYYTRWFYMPSLILALASAKAVEEPHLPLRKGYIFYGVLWGIFGIVFLAFRYYFKVTFVYNLVPVAVFMAISLGGFGVTLFLRKIQQWKHAWAILLALTMGFAGVTGIYNIYLMQKCWQDGTAPESLFTSASQIYLPQEKEYYRVDADGYYFYNLGTMAGFAGMDSFSSTVSPSIFEFYELCGEPRSVISDLPAQSYGYRAFLSAKYWARYKTESTDDIFGWKYIETQGDYAILENEYALPMGFTYEYYITPEQFASVPQEERHLVLLKALVLSQQEAEKTGCLQELPEEMLQDRTEMAFVQDVEQHKQEIATSTTKTQQGYESAITLAQEKMVFYSIPWDAGWSVRLDDAPVEIVQVSGGFMAVKVPAGTHTLTFTYRAQGASIGVCISAVSIVAVVVWFVMDKKQKERK